MQDLRMHERVTIKFDGGLAQEHLMPFFSGGESIAGLGLCFLRVNHFVLSGEVRWRAPYDTRQQLLISPPKGGSIEFSLAAILAAEAPTTMIGQLAISATPAVVIGLAIHLFKRLTGQPADSAPDIVQKIENQRPGDVAALASSITPPLKRAHTIINNGAGNVFVFGDETSVRFDGSTKEYLDKTIDDEDDAWIDVSIAWLNGNSKTGGAYNYELGQVVPFHISKSASRQARETLSRSASAYFVGDRDRSRVSIRVYAKRAPDNRLKSYFLIDAKEIGDDTQHE
jgi:hypothetical protein